MNAWLASKPETTDEKRRALVQQAAERFKVDQQTVRNWIDRGELPAVRVGARRMRIRESDFDAFVTAGEVRAVSGSGPDYVQEWQAVRDAIKLASAAARVRDTAELRRALADLSDAAAALGER